MFELRDAGGEPVTRELFAIPYDFHKIAPSELFRRSPTGVNALGQPYDDLKPLDELFSKYRADL